MLRSDIDCQAAGILVSYRSDFVSNHLTSDGASNIRFMPRGSASQPAAPASTGDAGERILAAAERCIERHGVYKTTMDDIASEVGMSRPSVYRYFADRDDLLIELITRHTRVLLVRARKAGARQGSLSDQLIESVLYAADHCRRDPLTRHVIDPDATSLGRRVRSSGTSEMLAAELWEPFLDAAFVNNELPRGLSRSDIHVWLRSVAIMVMRGLENEEGDLKRYRSLLRRFFAPAFAGQTNT
jgi:AcrR family transcriptional regulator